ncbi:MAG: uracil-DNA glycosylase [Nitrosomonadales bacterium]|nr:uracil-DNA glycosylase [Nitrosomonadales bacterium]
MDRNEAILRELNLYPLWVRRDMPAPATTEPASAVAEQPVAEHHAATGAEPVERMEPSFVPSSASGELDWPQLKQKVRDCTACKLRAGCTQTVFGVGDERAEWLFVGEGPGADEDALGEPFVGQAGKLLDNMLLAIRLKRGDNAYIANIVKCRPPGNRNPEPDEIASCLPYLQRQIELIRPKIIVALGKVASNALLGKDATMASLRGTLHDYRGIPMVVTYHPAYLLRSPSEKAKAWQDLCMAVQTLKDADTIR